MYIKSGKRDYPPLTATKEKLDAILEDIKEGGSNRHSAEANGISQQHFYRLLKQGQIDLDDGKDSLAAYLLTNLRKIELDEIKICKKSIALNKRGHFGKQWILEKFYPYDFGHNVQANELKKEIDELRATLGAKDETNSEEAE